MLFLVVLNVADTCNLIREFSSYLEDGQCYGCPMPIGADILLKGRVLIMCQDDFQTDAEFNILGTLVFFTSYQMEDSVEFTSGTLRFAYENSTIYVYEADLNYIFANTTLPIVFLAHEKQNQLAVAELTARTIVVNDSFLEITNMHVEAVHLIYKAKCVAVSIECVLLIVYGESTLMANLVHVYNFSIGSFASADAIFAELIDLGKNSILIADNVTAAEIKSAANSVIEAKQCTFGNVVMINEIMQIYSRMVCSETLDIAQIIATDYTNISAKTLRISGLMSARGVVMAESLYADGAILYLYREPIIVSLWFTESDAFIFCECSAMNLTRINLVRSKLNITTVSAEFIEMRESQLFAKSLSVWGNAFAKQDSTIRIASYSLITSADFDESVVFATGSLRIRQIHGFHQARIPNLWLEDASLSYHYFQILQTLGNADVDSAEFSAALEQLTQFNGTLVIDPACRLFSGQISASAVVAYGYMLPFTNLNTSKPELRVHFLFCYFFPQQISIKTLEFINAVRKLAYLRLCRTLEIDKLVVQQTHLLINRNQKAQTSIFTYEITVTQTFSVDNDSAVFGAFSLLTSSARMYEIQQITGHFEVSDMRVYASYQSAVVMGQFRLDVPDMEIELSGSIASLTSNLYQASVVIQAKSLVLGNITVQCNYVIPPKKTCCGGSMRNFGGCSYGIPHSLVFTDKIQYLHPIQGIPGDSCRREKVSYKGSNSGGFLLIKVYYLRFGIIDASGQPSIINTTDSGCGGAGSGGYVEIHATNVTGNMITVKGGNCNEECISGGAGSAGVVVLNDKVLTDEAAKEIPLHIDQTNGQCKYPVIQSAGYCNALMKLNSSKMTCSVPLWLTISVMLIGSVTIAGFVSASVNLMTWFRNKYA